MEQNLSKNVYSLVKDIEIEGGGKVKYLLKSIPLPTPHIVHPFNYRKPYLLWRPLVWGPGIFNIINNNYAEKFTLTYNGVSNIFYFKAGQFENAKQVLEDKFSSGNEMGFIISYKNNNTNIKFKAADLTAINNYLKTLKTDGTYTDYL